MRGAEGGGCAAITGSPFPVLATPSPLVGAPTANGVGLAHPQRGTHSAARLVGAPTARPPPPHPQRGRLPRTHSAAAAHPQRRAPTQGVQGVGAPTARPRRSARTARRGCCLPAGRRARAHTHTHTHSLTHPRAHAHTGKGTHTHKHTHKHTHTNTHTGTNPHTPVHERRSSRRARRRDDPPHTRARTQAAPPLLLRSPTPPLPPPREPRGRAAEGPRWPRILQSAWKSWKLGNEGSLPGGGQWGVSAWRTHGPLGRSEARRTGRSRRGPSPPRGRALALTPRTSRALHSMHRASPTRDSVRRLGFRATRLFICGARPLSSDAGDFRGHVCTTRGCIHSSRQV